MSRIDSKPLYRTTAQGHTTIVRVTVELPEATYDEYVQQSIARGLVSPEQLMGERLTRARNQVHDALVFTSEQKRRLDKALGHTISDAEGALQRLENHMKLEVADVTVELEPRVITRINTRAKAMRKDFAQCLRHEVVGALRRFTGFDPA